MDQADLKTMRKEKLGLKGRFQFLFCACCISLLFGAAFAEASDWERNQNIAQIASKYDGVPYKYGGKTPKGFDCSGFTMHVLRKAGIDIPRTTKEQYRIGDEVAKSDLKKGDLVFFIRRPSGKISTPNHVAIYIGRGKFIHASTTDKKIRCDELSNPYWSKRYKGARRLM